MFVNCGRISIVISIIITIIIIIITIIISIVIVIIIITIITTIITIRMDGSRLGAPSPQEGPRKDPEGPRCRTHGRLARSSRTTRTKRPSNAM